MSKKIYIKTCLYCDKEFEATSHTAGFCCDEHKRLHKSKKQRYYRCKKLGLPTDEDILEAEERKKRMSALADFNAEARKLNMSYGQYYAWLYYNKAL